MLLPIISAILLILAFPNFNLTFLIFIGFVPIFFAVSNESPKKAFLIFYFCGFLFYSGVLYWLFHVTLFGLVVLCLYLALYFGIFGFLLALFRIESRRVSIFNPQLLFIPIIWVILEYIQSRLFTGFGWALLGYSQYRNLPLIQIANFSGVYGVSFVIMMANVAIFKLFKKSLREMVTVTIVLIIIVGYGIMRINGERTRGAIKVSIIQGNIPQEVKWDPRATSVILNKYATLTKITALEGPDLIIWPETSFPGFLIIDKDLTQGVLDLVKDIKIPLLLGANTEEGLRNFNSAVLVSEKGEIIDKYDKIHLVPFGEYVPFSNRFPFLHSLILGELGEFSEGSEFKIFKLTAYSLKRKANFAVLICFEDIFPELARKFVKNGAEFLVIITNDAWYGDSGAPYQHAACSVFRAIENRIPVIRCANTGYSCFIDSRGRIYDSVEGNNTHLFITGCRTSEVRF